MNTVLIYATAGVILFSLGLAGLFFCNHAIRRILAVNFAGSGVFLVLISMAHRETAGPRDAVPHALVLTGIVVAVSATAVALALYRRLASGAAEMEEPHS